MNFRIKLVHNFFSMKNCNYVLIKEQLRLAIESSIPKGMVNILDTFFYTFDD